jgi:hypothetical protein
MKNIETSRHEVDIFWQKIKERILILIPILILLLPDSNPLKVKLLNLQDSQDDINESNFLAQIENIVDQIKSKDKNIVDISQSMKSYTAKKLHTQELVENTLEDTEEFILEMADIFHKSSQELKTPEEMEKQVLTLITDYEGREVGKSQQPSSNRFQTELLLEEIQKYRQYYDQQQIIIENHKAKLSDQIRELIKEYTLLVEREIEYDQQSVLKIADNLFDTLSSMKYSLSQEQRASNLINYFDQYKNLKSETTLINNKHKNLKERVSYFFLHPLLTDLHTPQEISEKIKNKIQIENIPNKISLILLKLRKRYDEYVQQFFTNSLIQDTKNFYDLQQEYQENLHKLTLLGNHLLELANELYRKGVTIALDSWSFIPMKPSVQSFTIKSFINLYQKFSQSLQSKELRYDMKIENTSLNVQEVEELEKALQDCIFNDLSANNPRGGYFLTQKFQLTHKENELLIIATSLKIEKERKSQALQFLKDNNLETPAHIAMINNVQFTKEAIVIGGVPRAHENAKASDFGLTYSVDNKDNPADYSKSHVFKGEGAYADEDYFNYAMVDKIVKEKQAKVPTYQDMRKALAALPGGPSGKIPNPPSTVSRNVGSAKLMSILLGTEMSGYRERWRVRRILGFLWLSVVTFWVWLWLTRGRVNGMRQKVN